MASPYRNRPQRSFWKSTVGRGAACAPEIYSKRFDIDPDMRIATAGSCFAQHIATHLVRRGFDVIDAEPPPRYLSLEIAQSFGYNLYSARYGNIYTARQMVQLAKESFGRAKPADIVWESNGRFYDSQRPNVEPTGLDSPEEVLAHREDHLSRVRSVLSRAELLVFTLGLTEAWVHKPSGTVFPTAPETIAGRYSPDLYEFRNFSYGEVLKDLTELRRFLKKFNRNLRLLLTVSPVPLIATATDHHVLVATTYSKSVLRAAAGAMYDMFEDVDYFPSYEIIATPFSGRRFYEDDFRSVTREGVETVMNVFFAAHDGERSRNVDAPARPASPEKASNDSLEEVICEEALLEAFAR